LSTAQAQQDDMAAPVGRHSDATFEATGERSRQRYLLSMLLRYPRMIAPYSDVLGPLRPDEERMGATWDYILSYPEARTFDDFAGGLEDSDLVTLPYLEAILRDTSAYPTLEEARLRVALEDAITLLRAERLRLEIGRYQRELREAEGEDRGRLLEHLVVLTRQKVALDYNREKPAESAGLG
ncbi:MAG TPA: hypothetical protein VIU62_22805, partial [Chloroflexota bacterium]